MIAATSPSPMSTPVHSESQREQDPPRGGIIVEVCDTQSRPPGAAQTLAALAERVLRGEGIHHAEISLALVDNATIQRINREHLQHDWPTDVISFLLSQPGEPELIGEVIVSAEMARTTAAQLEVDPVAELSLYVVHGLLHLCGYDDASYEDARVMRAREELALQREGLTYTFPLAERTHPAGAEREQDA